MPAGTRKKKKTIPVEEYLKRNYENLKDGQTLTNNEEVSSNRLELHNIGNDAEAAVNILRTLRLMLETDSTEV